MYIIFKVCLEYYLYIKYNNKKNWYSSRAPVPSKNMLKRLGFKKTINMAKPHRLCSIENLNIIFTLKNLSNY